MFNIDFSEVTVFDPKMNRNKKRNVKTTPKIQLNADAGEKNRLSNKKADNINKTTQNRNGRTICLPQAK